jgi:predicted DNA-binding protein (MmcQ/YjbR family)
MSDTDILKWVDHSYELVVASLPKKLQATFELQK